MLENKKRFRRGATVILPLAAAAFAASLQISAATADTHVLPGTPSVPSVERRQVSRAAGQSVIEVNFALKSLETERQSGEARDFNKVSLDQLPVTSEPGLPEVPFYAVTVPVAKDQIQITATLGQPAEFKSLNVFPAQPEKCRCEADAKQPAFQFNASTYQTRDAFYQVEQLGDYRGTPVSRVLIYPHHYDAASRALTVYPNAKFEIQTRGLHAGEGMSSLMAPVAGGAYDYLVLAPSAFHETLKPWMDWKTSSQGLRFKVISLEETGNDVSKITQKIKSEYQQSKFQYALIVGSQNMVNNHRVSTSGSSQTPSDLPYFTMSGKSDMIPDVYAGRLVVENTSDLRNQLSKLMAYERSSYASTAGWGKAIGVASNEGSGPSDNEYVTAIQEKIQSTVGTAFTHFYQANSDSTPDNFNQAMNGGAMWMTYMGHGSGSSWPSFGQSYGLSDIKRMANSDAVKPIWIDVACQNGKLVSNSGGERLMNEVDGSGNPIGVTAFYGGTVNISWHPPAILARGIAFKLAESGGGQALGQALQAGHVYLSENNSAVSNLQDNQRWYHLQGDPSLKVRIK